MLNYEILGTNGDFLGFGIFDNDNNVNVDIVSANSTTVVLFNNVTGATTTITGTGFTFSGTTPTGGTATGISVSDGTNTIGNITGINWNLVTFNQALEDLENDNDSTIAALINGSGPMIVDTTGATGDLNTESDMEGILELLNTGITYISGSNDDNTNGTAFNDTFIVSAGSGGLNVEATQGNDTFDVTNVSGYGTYLFIDYDQDYSTPGAITANVNGLTGAATIQGTGFTDTILGVANILVSDGLGIQGSALNDTFNATLGGTDEAYQWMSVTGAEGVDTYNITLNENSTVRLDFRYGANIDPFTGLIMNVGTGVISNDGFGNMETLNYTDNGGRLEIRGTYFNDDIVGSGGSESFILLGGNDTVDGGDGFDRVRYDRNGVDAVMVDLTTGTATGTWNGVGFIHDLTSIEEIRGSRYGNDTIIGTSEDERFDGRGGDDSLVGGNGDDTLIGGDGNDTFLSGGDNDEAHGGHGDDTIYGGGGNDLLTAYSGANEMFGGSGNDTIEGGSDGDLMGGGGGFDILQGNDGNDTMFGSSGNDTIEGGEGDDFAGGGANNDYVTGGNGDDTLYGGGNRDVVEGGNNNDLLGGGAGRDIVNGGSGDDTLWGQAGSDTLNGGQGNDDMAGGGQGDLLIGAQGDDTMNGGFGNDTLSGGADNDVLNGNFGDDVLTGGLGADTFVFDSNGNNTVTDFNAADGDMLSLDDALWAASVPGTLTAQEVLDTFGDDSSGTVVITIGSTAITLSGVSSLTGLADNIEIF